VAPQNVSDGAAGKFVPQIRQGALDAAIAPLAVFFGHAHDQSFQLVGRARPSRSALAAAVVLLGNQLSVPREQGLGRDDGRHL
jgi:hypothetical protein